MIMIDDIDSIFNINGFQLDLFAYEMLNENHVFIRICLLSIDVENIVNVSL